MPDALAGLAGNRAFTLKQAPAPEVITTWAGLDHDIRRILSNGWYGITWEGRHLEAVMLSGGNEVWYFLVGESRQIAEGFYLARALFPGGGGPFSLPFDKYAWGMLVCAYGYRAL